MAVRQAVSFQVGQPLPRQNFAGLESRLKAADLPLDRLKITVSPAGEGARSLGSTAAPDEVELIFDFTPPPQAAEIRIFPLIPVDIKSLPSSCTLHAGDPYDPKAVETAAAALSDSLHKAGAADAIVTPILSPLTTTTLSIGFIISGAVPPKLIDVRFRGGGWFDGPGIREQLKHLEPAALDKGSSVTATLLESARLEVAAVEQAQGYLEARTRLAETLATPKGVRVTYQIERGPRYHIQTAAIAGKRFPDPKIWDGVSEDYVGKTFTAAHLHDFEEAIKRQAEREGYLAPDVKLAFAPAQGEKKVAIDARVDEGTTSTLGAVVIERSPPERGYGTSWYHRHIAPPVAEEVIRRQIRAEIGAPLTNQAVLDATRRLNSTDVFDKVDVQTAATSSTLVRNLVAKLRDRRTLTMGTSLGWSADNGPFTRFTVTERNVGGRADNASFGISLDQAGVSGGFTYLDRNWKRGEQWLGEDRDPSLLYSVYLNQHNYDEYLERRAGGALQASWLVGDPRDNWTNAWEAQLEEISFDPFHSKSSYAEKFGSYLAATVAYRLTMDTRIGSEWDSTSGMLFDSEIQAGLADGPLLKWTTRVEWRHLLARHWLWLVQGEVGLMPMRASSVGLAHRFQGGGENELRGFDEHGIGPVDPKNNQLHTGGATNLVLRNEVRYLWNDSIQIPLFVDIGALDDGPLSVGGVRASVGFGVRFAMPGSTQRAYLYLAQNVLHENTDNERTIRFGYTIDF